MKLLELSDQTRVQTVTGEDLGTVDRFVIDPSTREVTHLVVKRGVFFPEERVVPTEAVTHTDLAEGLAILDRGVTPDELPVFEEEHYVDIDPQTRGRLVPEDRPVTTWAYPYAPVAGIPLYPSISTATARVRERNVPAHTAVVDEGARVTAADGEKIGSVTEVSVAEDGTLSHITVDTGFFRSDKILPAHWIESVDEDGIRLALGAETLREYDRR